MSVLIDGTLGGGYSFASGEALWRARARAALVARLAGAGIPLSELRGLLGGDAPSKEKKKEPNMALAPYRHQLHAFAELRATNGGRVPQHARGRRWSQRFAILGAYWDALGACSWRGSLVKAFEEPSLHLPALSDTGIARVPRMQFLLALGYALVRPAERGGSPRGLSDAAWSAMLEDLLSLGRAG